MNGPRPSKYTRSEGDAIADVHYQARLIYLGEPLPIGAPPPAKKDSWEPPPHERCKFWLEKEDASRLRRGDALHPSAGAPLGVSERIRLVIRDNTCVPRTRMHIFGVYGDKCSKANFMENWGTSTAAPRGKLVEILWPFVPVCLEVRKFQCPKEEPDPISDGEIFAVLEVEDPPEETKHLSARPRAFIDRLQKIPSLRRGSAGNDNCSRKLVRKSFGIGCRQTGSEPDAMRLLSPYYSAPQAHARAGPLGPGWPLFGGKRYKGTKIKLELPASDKDNIVRYSFLFSPSPISGDNYKIKVALKNAENEPVMMKEWDGTREIQEIATHEIVIWRKVSVDLLIVQASVARTRDRIGGPVDFINWDELIKIFEPAYIMLETKDREYFDVVDWYKYLRAIYQRCGHGRVFDEAFLDSELCDFENFLLPQDPRLVQKDDGESSLVYDPGDVRPFPIPRFRKDRSHTARAIIGELVDQILRDKIVGKNARERAKNRQRLFNPLTSEDMGLYVLLTKPPAGKNTPLTKVHPEEYNFALRSGGFYWGDKQIFMFEFGRPITRSVAHEIGHALFIRHGVTMFENDVAFDNRKPGRGAYLDDHDWEDTVPCLMSYNNTEYCRFCGMCLLTLRFYDRVEVATNEDVQRDLLGPRRITLQDGGKDGEEYDRLPAEVTWSPGIFISDWEKIEAKKIERAPGIFKEIAPLTISKGRFLTAFSDLEPHSNDMGGPFYKDIGAHPRGWWWSKNKEVGEVHKVLLPENKRLTAVFEAKKSGTTRIQFKLGFGGEPRKCKDPMKSNTVTINVRI